LAEIQSCINCYYCKVRADHVRCAKGMWKDKDGNDFIFSTLDSAKQASRRVLAGGNYGYMSNANHCPNYDP
jgi:hypothetical protein